MLAPCGLGTVTAATVAVPLRAAAVSTVYGEDTAAHSPLPRQSIDRQRSERMHAPEAAREDAESDGSGSLGDVGVMWQRGPRNNNASYAAARAKLMKSASTSPS